MSDESVSVETSAEASASVSEAAPDVPTQTGAVASSEGGASEADQVADTATSNDGGETFTAIVDGETVTYTRDEVQALLQKGAASEKRFREAAALRKKAAEEQAAFQKQVSQLRQQLTDPDALFGVLERLHGAEKLRALLSDRLLDQFRFEALSPDEQAREREVRDLRAKARRLEEIESREQETRAETQRREAFERFESQAKSALQELGVTPSPETIESWARYRLELARAGVTDAAEGARAAAELVGEETSKRRQSSLESLLSIEDDEAFVESLPKPLRERFERIRLQEMEERHGKNRVPPPRSERAPSPETRPKVVRVADVMAEIRAARRRGV